jgi:hypothetical protein
VLIDLIIVFILTMVLFKLCEGYSQLGAHSSYCDVNRGISKATRETTPGP